MPVQFFGQYLLSNKIITREQLLEAVDFQDSQNLKLGEYAIRREYITEDQVNSINNLQQSKDLRFGDAAIELGFLTAPQVSELLTIQRNSHIYLGDAVIQKGFADGDTIKRALDGFKKEQEQYTSDDTDLSELGLPNANRYAACLDLTKKLLLRMWDARVKIGTATNRTGTVSLPGFVVQVSFTGQFNTRFILAVPEPIVSTAAKKILNEEETDRETGEDLLREFANVVSGNVVALLAKQGQTCDIQPPVTISSEVDLGPENGVFAPIITPNGDGVILLTYN
jgi:CheY-specific phosphatase CheX